MIIDGCPRSLQVFFRPLQRQVSKPQYHHLWAVVLAIGVNLRGSKLIHLAAAILDGRHRTALGGFLRSSWDPAAALEDRVQWLLRQMKPRPGEIIELLIDDVRIAKRGRKMAGIQKIWDHTEHRYVYGHIVVVGAIRFRGVVMPWRVELWMPKWWAGRHYRKMTEIAAEMIEALPVAHGMKVRVLFDAFYLCPTVVKACEKRDFLWFSVAARHRTFQRDGGRRDKIGQLASGWIRHLGRNVRMPRSRGTAKLRIAQADGWLSRIGRVRLVASKRPRDPWKSLIAFATDETGLDARKIVSIYEGRWSIEVMFKELRSDLGLGDYQVMDEQAIVAHLHLCCLAHLVLTHHSMEAVGAQARKANQEVPLPPMSLRLEALRTTIRRDQVRRILRGPNHRRLRMKLEPYLRAA